MPLSEALVSVLACPVCHGALATVSDPEGYGCATCSKLYRVADGIANLLVDDAVEWTASSSVGKGNR